MVSNNPQPDQENAWLLMEVVPAIMRFIRAEMRDRRTDLSVVQFRALAFLNRRQGASLSDVAEHVGLTLPSMSKLIDGLVGRGLLLRQASADDRRRVCLSLTATGKTILEVAREGALERLTEILRPLSPADQARVSEAMRVLNPLFSLDRNHLPKSTRCQASAEGDRALEK